MASFPELPPAPENTPWSPNVYQAYDVIVNAFRHAAQVSCQGDTDPMRLRFHWETLMTDCVPLLIALETHSEQENLPRQWIHACTEALGTLVAQLQSAELAMEDRYIFLLQCVCKNAK
jgi:hypothetical protein